MEDRQGKLVHHLVLAILLLAMPSLGLAQDGTASGSITVNGARVPLRHAYAMAQPGFFDKATEDIRILLSDNPVPEESRGDVFALMKMARAGRLQAIEVVVSASGSPLSGSLYIKEFNGSVSVAGMHRFEPKAMERARIAGRLFVEGPSTFAGNTWQYDATFSAPIPRPPTPEELAAALASPPALAAAAYLAEVRGKGDIPADSKVVALARPSPTTAIVTALGHRASDGVEIEFTIDLALQNGVWKVIR